MAIDLSRRKFIAALGGVAASWPVVARAQQLGTPVVGLLSARSADESALLVLAFRDGLREAGYDEGRDITIEYRWAEGNYDRLPVLAAELVQHNVAAIVAPAGTVSALAAKAATSIIPVVFVVGADPVGSGLVKSINRPEGNITGISVIDLETQQKRMELICELVPNEATIGLLINPTNPLAKFSQQNSEEAAYSLKRQIALISASKLTDLEPAFGKLIEQGVGALLASPDPFFNDHVKELSALAAKHRIPTVAAAREFAVVGGLASYGASFADAYRQAGIYTGRILKGARPGDLPVQQAAKFELAINLKTAKALGITVPRTLLIRADEVIE
jgi:putative tryptophan/tyrosine transport system substrate-binding protein